GIGKATAKLFASKGANVTILARTQSVLETAKAEIEAVRLHPDQRVLSLVCDVSDRSSAEQAIQTAIEQIGPPDYLVTSAGIAIPGYFHEQALEIFERTMAVNYWGTLYCIRAVLPAMQKQGKGQIVLVSSGAGLIGIYGYTTYSPTKFALRGLAESLRGELKVFGIDLAIVYPPDTDTPQLWEENKTKPAQTKAITATAKMWTAEGVAEEIIKGIQQKKFAITPGLEMKLLNRLNSFLVPLLNWYFDRLVKKTSCQ
ncbi:MAG TPA: short-chain dehydrogenase, partial [Cyanobacteria bacterium UBA8543]|nr:short-chain dehydrogenase [Cyanobacteria bacterium UBA8543]